MSGEPHTIDSLNIRISKRSASIKGIAILGIMLYHYFRASLGRPNDIQWAFTDNILQSTFDHIIINPGLACAYLLQTFGYLGVPLFFILSGWGLAYKYLNSDKPQAYLEFLKHRLGRLLPMYYISLLFFGCLFIFSYRHDPLLLLNLLQDLASKFLLLHNFIPAYTFSFNSVYWFIPAIVSLYLLFPLIYKISYSKPVITTVCAILVSYALSLFFLQERIHTDYPAWGMGAFPFTRLGEFTLGIAIAICGKNVIRPMWLFFVGLILIVAGCLSYQSFFSYPFHNILLGTGLLSMLISLPHWPKFGVWAFTGTISYSLFLFHRPFIPPWIEHIQPAFGEYASLASYLAVILAACWLTQKTYDRFYVQFRRAISIN